MQAYITMNFTGSIADNVCRTFEYMKVAEVMNWTYFKKHIVLPLQRKNKQYQESPSRQLSIAHIHTKLFFLPTKYAFSLSSEGVNNMFTVCKILLNNHISKFINTQLTETI